MQGRDPRTGTDRLVCADQLFGPWIPDTRNKTVNVRDKDDQQYGECPCGRIGMIDHHQV